MRWLRVMALVSTLGLQLPNATSAALATFSDRAAWVAAVGGSPDFTETFEEFTSDTSFQLAPLALPDFSITQVPPRDNLFSFHNSVQVAPFQSGTPSSLTTPHVRFFLEGDSALHVQVAFDNLIGAWGADYGDSGFDGAQVQIGFDGGGQATLSLPANAQGTGFFENAHMAPRVREEGRGRHHEHAVAGHRTHRRRGR